MAEVKIEEHFWQGDDEAVLTTWYFDDGDKVEAGETIAEIMLEKTQMEIEATSSGTLTIRTAADDPVRKGDIIAEIA